MRLKYSLILSACAIFTPAINAQQALWDASDIISPEIHQDKSVTFRLYAPNAGHVELTGDFLPTMKIATPFGESEAPGKAEMVKNSDGVW